MSLLNNLYCLYTLLYTNTFEGSCMILMAFTVSHTIATPSKSRESNFLVCYFLCTCVGCVKSFKRFRRQQRRLLQMDDKGRDTSRFKRVCSTHAVKYTPTHTLWCPLKTVKEWAVVEEHKTGNNNQAMNREKGPVPSFRIELQSRSYSDTFMSFIKRM